jgi:hypothetical protein
MVLTLAVLLFGSVLMLGLAVDLARVAAAWREAAHAATTAAEVGAGWVDEEAARGDRLVLDPRLAHEAALTVASAPGRTASVSVEPERVCVTVARPLAPSLLTMVGAVPATVTASSCAEPRKG